MALQENRDIEIKKIESHKQETTQKLQTMTRKIDEGKKLHDSLTSEVRVALLSKVHRWHNCWAVAGHDAAA